MLKTRFEGGNRGEAGDVFATDGPVRAVNNITNPSTRLADGPATSVTIHSIESDGSVARIVISAAEFPVIAVGSDLGTIMAPAELQRDLPLGGGALPYTVTLGHNTAPDGLSLRAVGERL